MNRKFLIVTLSLLYFNLSFGQNLNDGQKRWSSANKLSFDDYKIKISGQNADVVYSQFKISHSIGGLDFLKNNLNQKIENIFLGNASWIDTTKVENIQKQIEFQQIQFDLSEVYVREFRKKILQNKGQIVKGFDIVREIDNQVMEEFSRKRAELMEQTESGRNQEEVLIWEEWITGQLAALKEFSYDNKNKIKLTD
ncbi:hypothetical protein [uncultured Salegentibacter sp.]|uniref:hypothetical protein n=1 Tax=uncultured Salegentibacter sp. TaxID=259320 RepID=UPI0030DB5290